MAEAKWNVWIICQWETRNQFLCKHISWPRTLPEWNRTLRTRTIQPTPQKSWKQMYKHLLFMNFTKMFISLNDYFHRFFRNVFQKYMGKLFSQPFSSVIWFGWRYHFQSNIFSRSAHVRIQCIVLTFHSFQITHPWKWSTSLQKKGGSFMLSFSKPTTTGNSLLCWHQTALQQI